MESEKNELMPTTDDALVPLVDPGRVMAFAVDLRKYINQNNLSINIPDGKGGTNQYAKVDGWRFAGMNFGLIADVTEPIQFDKDATLHIINRKKTFRKRNGENYTKLATVLATTNPDEVEKTLAESDEYFVRPFYGFKCTAQIKSLATGKVVGHGFAICTNAESAKLGFDMYAVASMAQTRASGKGFRNVIGYIMNSAGYQTTPAEEMPDEPKESTNAKPTAPGELMTGAQKQQIDGLLKSLNDKAITERINKSIGLFTVDDADTAINYLENLILDLESQKS